MLPFLKNRQKSGAGLIVQQRTPDEKPQEDQDDSSHDEAILACAQDLIDGIHAQDKDKVAEALRSAFEILELMPHDEVEHDEDNSYAGRNAAAAKESAE